MLEVMIQYEDMHGIEKVILGNGCLDDYYKINLNDLKIEKIWNFDDGNMMSELCEDMNFEGEFSMSAKMNGALIKFLKQEITEYEEGYDIEDVIDRQRLDFINADPFFDGGCKKEEDFIGWVKDKLDEWAKEEYDSELDFSNLKRIPLAYTNAGNRDKFEIQVYIDLIDFEMWTEVNKNKIAKEKFNSLNEFWDKELSCMNFDSLVSDGINYCESEE